MTFKVGDYVRIIGPGEYDTPTMDGQVGQIILIFAGRLRVETSPGAHQWAPPGRYDPSKWDNFWPEALAPASEDEIADYLIRHLSA